MELDLFNLDHIEDILKRYRLRPAKKFGQNFILNKQAIIDIVKSADVSKNDLIVEIGPGLGVLTRELSKAAKNVIAIEKDPNMVRILKETLKGYNNVEIIEGDALKYRWDKLDNYKVVANIPYYITAPLIRTLLESLNPPKEISLMVQKEVAERICARPPHLNIIAIATQYYADPQMVNIVDKSSFFPVPKIDSAILNIKVRNKKGEEEQKFFKFIKAGFASPRKTLLNNLSNNLKLERLLVEEKLKSIGLTNFTRAENLSIEQWKMLIKSFEL